MCVSHSFNDEVIRYYYLALLDLLAGVTFEELERTINFYEEIENYEAAAGIVKALNEAEYYTIKTLTQKIEELEEDERIKDFL